MASSENGSTQAAATGQRGSAPASTPYGTRFTAPPSGTGDGARHAGFGPGQGDGQVDRQLDGRITELERLLSEAGPLHRNEIGGRLGDGRLGAVELAQVLRVAGRERRIVHQRGGVYAVGGG